MKLHIKMFQWELGNQIQNSEQAYDEVVDSHPHRPLV